MVWFIAMSCRVVVGSGCMYRKRHFSYVAYAEIRGTYILFLAVGDGRLSKGGLM